MFLLIIARTSKSVIPHYYLVCARVLILLLMLVAEVAVLSYSAACKTVLIAAFSLPRVVAVVVVSLHPARQVVALPVMKNMFVSNVVLGVLLEHFAHSLTMLFVGMKVASQ